MKREFAGRVVVITGAGKGAGAALAEAFAARGAQVALNDISPINVDNVAARIVSSGGQARVYLHDVAKKVGVQALIKQVEGEWGRVDILIQHAAVQPRTPLLDLDEWDWHRTLDVNLTGAFLVLQSLGRVMRAQGGGIIVNLAAGAESAEQAGAYEASMAGLRGLSLAAARELAPFGVKVYLVELGPGALERVLELCSRDPSEYPRP
ncbi:MAG: SDR family NAD(P)-dependent oxidoreductase [Chloroflexi bacterium]|nr:SDR family NAD(P)-dependent oxidoreductase [Chloroflexota bacterium]